MSRFTHRPARSLPFPLRLFFGLVGLGALLGALASCRGRAVSPGVTREPATATSPAAHLAPAKASPSATTLPVPRSGATPAVTPSPTITSASTLTPTPTAEPVFFAGECTPDATDLCLRSWAWVARGGDRVLRYVFFHARYPAALKVRINGFQLACAPLAERQQESAVVCYGKPLGSLRGVVRLDFAYFLPDGRVLEGQVPAEVRPRLPYIFPVWFPPTPTPEEGS